MGEARGNKAGAELSNGEPGGHDEKERTGLRMGDVKLLLYKRHQRRKDEASHEIQKK